MDKSHLYDRLITESFSVKYGKLLIKNFNHGHADDSRRKIQYPSPGDVNFYDS